MTTTPTAVGENSVSQSQPGCAEVEPQLQASEPSAVYSRSAVRELVKAAFMAGRASTRSNDEQAWEDSKVRKSFDDEPAPLADVGATREWMRRRNEQMLSRPVPAAKSESHNHSEKRT